MDLLKQIHVQLQESVCVCVCVCLCARTREGTHRTTGSKHTISQNPMPNSECRRDFCCDAGLGVLELLAKAATPGRESPEAGKFSL